MLLDVTVAPPVPSDPCNPSPCGLNAQCSNGICSCITEYRGDPYRECRPECVQNSDCPYDRACANNKCVNPCVGICGQNAECSVVNHIATCSCTQNYEGDPFNLCRRVQREFLTFVSNKQNLLLTKTNFIAFDLNSTRYTL